MKWFSICVVHLVSKHWTLVVRHSVTLSHTHTHTVARGQRREYVPNSVYVVPVCSQNSLCCLSIHTLLTSISSSPSASWILAYTAASLHSVPHCFSCRHNRSYTTCFTLSALNYSLTRYYWGYASHLPSMPTHWALLSVFDTLSYTLVAWESIHQNIASLHAMQRQVEIKLLTFQDY